ncbi:hypothetical protein [Spirosoma pollinicola]|uniref:Uncharacterized protein n=1 Tax=Spirosoma pollinicola TaxID=2057025 RepID=A0A2K8Z4A5_9BACT|nr:hypothetical protein [Spirosoma pollinicola]AUD04664.1 hypothetical protein CWM47_24125 [Spirosoma pollinicola]
MTDTLLGRLLAVHLEEARFFSASLIIRPFCFSLILRQAWLFLTVNYWTITRRFIPSDSGINPHSPLIFIFTSRQTNALLEKITNQILQGGSFLSATNVQGTH